MDERRDAAAGQPEARPILASSNQRGMTESVPVTLSAAKGLGISFRKNTGMLRSAQHDINALRKVTYFGYATLAIVKKLAISRKGSETRRCAKQKFFACTRDLCGST